MFFQIWLLLAKIQFVCSYPKFEVILSRDLQRFWHKHHLLSSLKLVHKKVFLEHIR